MTDARPPLAALAALSAAVLAVHAWLLGGRAPSVIPAAAPAWQVRSIEPDAAPAAPFPARDAAPAPVSRPRDVRPAGPTKMEAARAAAPDPAPAAPPATPPARVPPPMVLEYQVTGRWRGVDVSGEARLDWHHDGREYAARLQVDAAPMPPRIQHSTGELGEAGVAPRRFSERTRGEQAVHFDRAAGRLVFSANRPAVPLEPLAQDRLSVLLQLAALFGADPGRYPPGSTIAVQTATARELGTWVFQVDGPASLPLPGRTVEAIRLARAPRHEWDPAMELWLAPGADYGPVRVRLTQPNGDWADYQWSSTDRGRVPPAPNVEGR